MKLLHVLILILIPTAIYADNIKNPYHCPDIASASYGDSPYAPIINPVFADESPYSLSYRYLQYDSKRSSNHFFSLNLFGLNAIYGWIDNSHFDNDEGIKSPRAHYIHVSKGFFFNNTFGIGGAYSYGHSEKATYNKYNSWDAGLLYRPVQFISFGVSLNNLQSTMNGEKITMKERYSLALRPFTSHLTISVDAIHNSEKNYKQFDYESNVQIRGFYNVKLNFKTNYKDSFTFGLEIPLYSLSNGSTTVLSSNRTYNTNHPNYTTAGFSLPKIPRGKGISISNNVNLLYISIDRPIKYNPEKDFFSNRDINFYEVLHSINTAQADNMIDGILINLDGTFLSFVQVQSLRQSLKHFKKSGKKVFVYIGSPSNKNYYLASVADIIYFTPNTPLTLTGLRGSVYFYKNFFDKIGVKVEVVKRGKYKAAMEPYSRQKPSEAFMTNFKSIILNLYKQMTGDIIKDRKFTKEQFLSYLNRGVFTPTEAKKLKLIDEINYLQGAIKNISSGASLISIKNYLKFSADNTHWNTLPKIAVVFFNGLIVRGRSNINEDVIGDTTFNKYLKRAFQDNTVKAIVIRIDSGGGSAAASDYILKELVQLKSIYSKPVVLSFGSTAASGGYYIACTGDPIFAQRGTITGSIGVIMGKPNLKLLFKKLGINKEVFKTHKFADVFSESRDITPEERKLFQKGIDFTYKRFTYIVSKARKIPRKKIPEVAEGKVFTGTQAKKYKLINKYGSIYDAITFAQKQVGLHKYTIKTIPEKHPSLTEYFTPSIGRLIKSKPFHQLLQMKRLKNDSFLLLLPYSIEIE